MRSALVMSLLILTSACSFERSTAPPPQPQKRALSICGHDHNEPCLKPLFVLDGKRLADDGNDLDPSEIASIDVFKGPSAVAMYGEDARNGVVVITSKRAAARKVGM